MSEKRKKLCGVRLPSLGIRPKGTSQDPGRPNAQKAAFPDPVLQLPLASAQGSPSRIMAVYLPVVFADIR